MGALDGRVALVTGGASGIGAATARRCAAEGASVVVADIDAAGAASVAASCGGRGVGLDVADATAWQAVVESIRAAEGRLDLVHLNAGVSGSTGDLLAMAVEELDRLVDVNLRGVLYGAHATAPLLVEGGGGAIVATASFAGLHAVPMVPIYAATKHGVVGFVRSIAPGLHAHGVTVAAVCPGFVATGMTAPAVEGARARGMAVLEPEEIADTVLRAAAGPSGACWVHLGGSPPEPFAFPEPPPR